MGIGAQVKTTERSRKYFLPQASDSAPSRGADKNDRMPYREYTTQHRTKRGFGAILIHF